MFQKGTTLDPGLRQPADWEALHALDCLVSPTPSISFNGCDNDISVSLDLNDIPIVLHSDSVQAGSSASVGDSVSVAEGLPPTMIMPSLSIGSCGTFGPRHDFRRSRSYSSIAVSSSSGGNMTPTSSRFGQPSVTSEDPNRASVLSRFTVSDYLSPEMQLRTRPRLSRSESNWTLPASPTTTRSLSNTPTARRLKSADALSSSAPNSPTPRYPTLRTLSSATSSIISATTSSPSSRVEPIDWANTIASIADRRARWFPPELAITQQPIETANIPTCKDIVTGSQALPRTVHIMHKPSHKDIAIFSTSDNSIGSSMSIQSPNSPQRSLAPSVRSTLSFNGKTPPLPESLFWLQNLDLEFWIDQEYRILTSRNHARSTMRLMGFTAPEPTVRSDDIDPLVFATAEFKPAIRQSFVFHHHSALDSLPVLKRIVILSDDPRDCISRQALLSLRVNGVYTISGTEAYDLSPSSPQRPHGSKLALQRDQLKLRWRFEYLVNDYRDANNDIIREQKTVTPLTFTCSPGLLHSSHGKKNKGMFDIFRKSLLPKIAAEKVQAPKPPKGVSPPSPSAASSPTGKTSPGIFRNPFMTGKTAVPTADQTSRHRRYHSSSTDILHQGPGQEYPTPRGSTDPAVAMVRRLTRGRAASIAVLSDVTASSGPANPWPTQGLSRGATPPVQERRRSVTAPVFKVNRHIVPPAELDDIISSPAAEDYQGTVDSGTGFIALRPPAYHARQRRVLPPSPLQAS